MASILRSSVQAPVDRTTPGVVLGDPGSVIAQVEAANEARNQAVEAMNAVYKPTFQPGGVGNGVPAFVSPEDPAPGFGDVPSTSGRSVVSHGNTSSGGWEPASGATTAAQEAATQPEQELPSTDTAVAADPATQNPATVQPAFAQPVLAQQDPLQSGSSEDTVQPAATTPTPALPTSQPGTDTPRMTPDYRSATPSVSTPVGSPNPGLPVVGRATPNNGTNPVVAQSSPRPVGTRGFGGPGMMPGAAGARRQDDETEHKIPDYLITEENANALVGNLPKTAPPVLGVWDEKS